MFYGDIESGFKCRLVPTWERLSGPICLKMRCGQPPTTFQCDTLSINSSAIVKSSEIFGKRVNAIYKSYLNNYIYFLQSGRDICAYSMLSSEILRAQTYATSKI